MPRQPDSPAALLPTLLLGAACGVLVGFGVMFASWIGVGAEACCPVGPLDPMRGAALGVATVLWARTMRRRYERDEEPLRIRSRRWRR